MSIVADRDQAPAGYLGTEVADVRLRILAQLTASLIGGQHYLQAAQAEWGLASPAAAGRRDALHRRLTGQAQACYPMDYIQWIGAGAYPTAELFVAEAQALGCSRRIAALPTDLVLGVSRVFLVHSEHAELKPPAVTPGDPPVPPRVTGHIIGYFVVDRCEAILDQAQAAKQFGPDASARLQALGMVFVDAAALAREARRLCGYRVRGEMYLVSLPDPTTTAAQVAADLTGEPRAAPTAASFLWAVPSGTDAVPAQHPAGHRPDQVNERSEV